MTNLRDRIRMPEEEVRGLIASGRHLQVASIGPDGRPHLVTMWYAVDEDGLIAFHTYAKSQKVKNLERDPRITVLLEDGIAYDELRGVMIEGEAEVIVGDPERTARVMALVGAKQSGAPAPDFEAAPPPVSDAARKRCVVRVHPQQVRTWDHRRLREGG